MSTEQFSDVYLDGLWKDAWNECVTAQQASMGQDTALWRAAGRATKDNPDKENGVWWEKNGRKMLDSWVDWRMGEHGWKVWETPQGIPAIELGMTAMFGEIPVQMGIDRVMVTPDGELVILDLKTGQRTPSSDLQLAFYATGMAKVFDLRPKYGAYWMARQGTTSTLIDLDFYTDEMIEEIIFKFDKARREELFVPNYGHCNMCQLKSSCKWNKEGTNVYV